MAAAAPELALRRTPTHVPFVIPDTDGTFQYTYSQFMVFGKVNKSIPGAASSADAAAFLSNVSQDMASPCQFETF